MNKREFEALAEAAERDDRWALFKRKTTEKLAARGWFEKAQHPVYGQQFRLTQAGFDAWAAEARS